MQNWSIELNNMEHMWMIVSFRSTPLVQEKGHRRFQIGKHSNDKKTRSMRCKACSREFGSRAEAWLHTKDWGPSTSAVAQSLKLISNPISACWTWFAQLVFSKNCPCYSCKNWLWWLRCWWSESNMEIPSVPNK